LLQEKHPVFKKNPTFSLKTPFFQGKTPFFAKKKPLFHRKPPFLKGKTPFSGAPGKNPLLGGDLSLSLRG